MASMWHFIPFSKGKKCTCYNFTNSFICLIPEAVYWLNLYQTRKYSIVPLQPPTILNKQERISKKLTYIGAGKECFNQTIVANFSSHVISISPFNFLLLLSNEVQKRSRLKRIKEKSPQVFWILYILGLAALAQRRSSSWGWGSY